MKKYKKIEKYMERGAKILGTEYALMGGAMTWISEANLVSAISNSGAFGVIASGAMDGNLLKSEVEATQVKTQKNFGVNIILMNPKLHDLIDVCGEKKVTHVILAGGIPDKSIVDKIHSYGMQILAFAPAQSIARRLFKFGIDALIIEGSEAGGHVGPVSTMVLIQDMLLDMKEYPIFVAGGIMRGEIFASMLQLGAVGCQLGTVFACCKESIAHEKFKQAFFRAHAKDAVTPVQLDKKFPVSPVRALSNIGTEEFIAEQRRIIQKFENGDVALDEGRLELEHFWAGALRRAVREGDVERGSLMAGQIVGLVKEERDIEQILDQIFNEAENFLNRLN